MLKIAVFCRSTNCIELPLAISLIENTHYH